MMADSARFVSNDAQAAHYLLWDHLFTPQKLVDGNRAVVSGAVVWDAAFTPYGAEESLLGSAVMKLRLPGQYADEETGRGGASSLTHPLYYNNPYRYANGNPKVYTDSRG